MVLFVWGMSAAAAPLEICNGLDDDGDGAIDEAPVAWGVDADGDGSGDASTLRLEAHCGVDPGDPWVADTADCDDDAPGIGPDRPEVCNGLDDDCDGTIDEGACDCDVEAFEGRALLFCVDPIRSWWGAQEACDNDGYHLVTIEDAALNAAIQTQTLPTGQPYWIGLSDLDDEGQFVWIDGSPLSFEDWDYGEPNDLYNEDCAEIDAYGGWDDAACGLPQAFVCEADVGRTWFDDADGDGLGDPTASTSTWPRPPGTVSNDADCDDADGDLPWAHGVDEDGDGYSGSEQTVDCEATPPGAGDCDDTDGTIYPGAPEVGDDGVDQDCDGLDTAGVPSQTGPGGAPVAPSARIPPPADYGFGLGCTTTPAAPTSWLVILLTWSCRRRRS